MKVLQTFIHTTRYRGERLTAILHIGRASNVNELYHHGILGQKWGIQNGPPYPLKGGDYSDGEEKEIRLRRRADPNSIYNKKHFDEVLKSDKTTLTTLSYDKDRTKKGDMFYAAHNTLDRAQYQALFNKKIDSEEGSCYKFKIENGLAKDMKIASEDSATKVFLDLYKKDRDFYNFVTNKDRMSDYFVDDKYKFKGYREARTALEKMRNGDYIPTKKDVSTVYRMFNYVIPYTGNGADNRGMKDVAVQRQKFFKALGKAGYGGLLDTNDAIYGGFKAKSPVIIFDVNSVVPKDVKQTKYYEIVGSRALLAARKMAGI